MSYKVIKNAIEFAIQEVRHERYEANQREEIDLNIFKMLQNVQDKLQEAIEEIEPF